MFRTIVWFTYFWIYQIGVIPVLICIKILDSKNKRTELEELVNKTVAKWARSLVKLTGSTVSVTGGENIPKSEAAVFISNHQGNFDIPILLGYIDKPKAFISKIEVKKIPLVSTWMKYMKCIFMDRKDIRQSVSAINEGAENLKLGYSYVIFPEGTRSKGNTINDFKQGSFKLALKAGAPIVPVTIKNSYKIMEQNGFIIKPASVEIIISPPVKTLDITSEEAKKLHITIKDIITANLIKQ